jgi:hypothetical protein
MYKNFNLTEQEKKQIMEMHKSHGYKKPLNEDIISTNPEPTNPMRNQQVEMGWEQLLSGALKLSPKAKMIRFKDNKYKADENSLNWGSHSGPGYDWGLSIAKLGLSGRGEFVFQSAMPQKSQMVLDLAKKYNLNVRQLGGNNSLESDDIYSIPVSKLLSFLKEAIMACLNTHS